MTIDIIALLYIVLIVLVITLIIATIYIILILSGILKTSRKITQAVDSFPAKIIPAFIKRIFESLFVKKEVEKEKNT